MAAKPASAKPDNQLRVGRELLDTTWRIAVPVVLLAGIGIVADRTWHTKPWLSLAGMALGFVCAAYLVKQQLDRWPAPLPKPGSYERNRRPGDPRDEDDEKDYYND